MARGAESGQIRYRRNTAISWTLSGQVRYRRSTAIKWTLSGQVRYRRNTTISWTLSGGRKSSLLLWGKAGVMHANKKWAKFAVLPETDSVARY